MDDFLHNLRKNSDRNYDRRNKQYNNPHNNPQYRGPERRGMRDQQRRPYQKRNELQEMVPEIKTLLTKIAAGQKDILDATQRQTDAQERQADVLEIIAGAMQRLVEMPAAPVSVSGPLTYAPEVASAQDAQGEHVLSSPVLINRDEVVELIVGLRQGGMTYKEIAQRLEDDQIPTFSGKGAWHAQTVHKVCKRGE